MADASAQVESILLERFSEDLARIRKRRLRMWIAFFGYVPFVLAVFIAGHFLAALEIAAAAAMGWMAICAVFVGMACLSRCPRCHDFFHFGGPIPPSPITNKCVNCRLPLQPPTGRPELFS